MNRSFEETIIRPERHLIVNITYAYIGEKEHA